MDEHNQEAKQGLDKAEKLLKRSKEVDYYKLLNVSRGATQRWRPHAVAPAAVCSATAPRPATPRAWKASLLTGAACCASQGDQACVP